MVLDTSGWPSDSNEASVPTQHWLDNRSFRERFSATLTDKDRPSTPSRVREADSLIATTSDLYLLAAVLRSRRPCNHSGRADAEHRPSEPQDKYGTSGQRTMHSRRCRRGSAAKASATEAEKAAGLAAQLFLVRPAAAALPALDLTAGAAARARKMRLWPPVVRYVSEPSLGLILVLPPQPAPRAAPGVRCVGPPHRAILPPRLRASAARHPCAAASRGRRLRKHPSGHR